MNKSSSKTDHEITAVLKNVNTIALVGASNKPERDSYKVMKYMLERGYKIIPVNPRLKGRKILSCPVRQGLKSLKTAIDMVDIFRQSEHVPALVDEILEMQPRPDVIWMQLGVSNQTAARKARSKGITVIMNRCPKIEYAKRIEARKTNRKPRAQKR